MDKSKRHLTVLSKKQDDDHFHDQCGVFGVFGNTEASKLTYLGLHALQHRGQESAGIASSDGENLFTHRAMGLVQDVFRESYLEKLTGFAAIGHVRYSTSGESTLRNAQPLAVNYGRGALAVCHNGNLTNAEELRQDLECHGSIFHSTTDTEIFIHLIAMSNKMTIEERIADALSKVQGAYSLLFLTEDKLIAVRDPRGVRPLCLGIMVGTKGNFTYVLSSETTALDLIDAKYVRDIAPGEMLSINLDGIKSSFPLPSESRKMCVFEFIYFARPDSYFDGRSVYEMRKSLGRRLAKEHKISGDIVIPVPDSGVPAAMGYATESGIPFEMGFIRSHYVGRTFIEPEQEIRNFGVRLKINPVSSVIKDKDVIVIDDSIVRGTTSKKTVAMLRQAGAKSVHLIISSPPTMWSCYYGIDTPTRKELIAANYTIDEIAKYVGVDSLHYLSLEGMLLAVNEGVENVGFCHACFSGDYSIPIHENNKIHRRLIRV
jgi:amidophosphoribosyltransferase